MNPKKAEGWDRVPLKDELILLGTPILIIRYGFCIPHRVDLLKEENIVYRWDKKQETRKEFFFGSKKPTRTYEGYQFCFLEYCQVAYDQKRFPEISELIGLDEVLMEKYKGFLERIVKQV